MSMPRLTQLIERTIDYFTNNLTTISTDHSYIHQGIAFTSVIQTGSISAAYDICFTTPDLNSNIYIHYRPIGLYTSANFVLFELREADTFSSGSAVTPINRNRNSLNVSKITTMVKDATCTPAGTLLQSGGIGTSGVPTSRGGGSSAADQEIVLKPSTNYTLTLTPSGATTCVVELFWYEEYKG